MTIKKDLDGQEWVQTVEGYVKVEEYLKVRTEIHADMVKKFGRDPTDYEAAGELLRLAIFSESAADIVKPIFAFYNSCYTSWCDPLQRKPPVKLPAWIVVKHVAEAMLRAVDDVRRNEELLTALQGLNAVPGQIIKGDMN